MKVPLQSEFPLRVVVCAWCKPKKRGPELGADPRAISHGICSRHLKEFKLELQKRKAAGQAKPAPSVRARPAKPPASLSPELNYPA